MEKRYTVLIKHVISSLSLAAMALILCTASSFANQGICLDTAQKINAQYKMPSKLLSSIALTESGYWDKKRKAKVAWPWTVTSGGPGKYFPTKLAAINYVHKLQAAGVTNIDVGCMQINMRYHPNAFSSLAEAFNPLTNVKYAAKHLSDLKIQWKSWREATRRYHSSNSTRGRAYEQRVSKNKRELANSSYSIASINRAKTLSKSIKKSKKRVDSNQAQLRREKARAMANAWRQRKLAEYLARKSLRKGS